jgi:hypothetical protein
MRGSGVRPFGFSNRSGATRAGRGALIGFVFLGAALAFGASPGAREVHDEPYTAAAPVGELAGQFGFRNGDVVLRRGSGVISRSVLTWDTRSTYSHAGLIVEDADGILVVHVEPRVGSGAGHVVVEPLAAFLAADRATAAAVYRLRSGTQAVLNLAVGAALDFADQKLPFDERFDVTAPTRLYCTELVWRAFRAAEIDLVPDLTERERPPWGGAPVILVSDLAGSSSLHRVAAWPTAPTKAQP